MTIVIQHSVDAAAQCGKEILSQTGELSPNNTQSSTHTETREFIRQPVYQPN